VFADVSDSVVLPASVVVLEDGVSVLVDMSAVVSVMSVFQFELIYPAATVSMQITPTRKISFHFAISCSALHGVEC
jgi:hypothetical protein